MRTSGILLPISSLPSKYGIGGFSKEAYKFIDVLSKCGQTYWQILPLGPTGFGDSPYQSFSAFAGNPYFIDLDTLYEEGLISERDIEISICNDKEIDYEKLYFSRFKVLKTAFENGFDKSTDEYISFANENAFWLDDYALYMAVKDYFHGVSWLEWNDDIKFRKTTATFENHLKDNINFYKYIQFLFFKQWGKLKAYANENGIKILGDIPIYVSMDSADTWANPEMFEFDDALNPKRVAGCPPDSFSKLGQLWGNPLYNWDYHRDTNYEWWINRIKFCFKLYDTLRIDHFRGFDEYYAIKFGDADATRGNWEKGPGIDLFNAINNAIPNADIIAEDLGFMTDSVKKLLSDTGYPGMKVLQFAFDGGDSDYLPHNYDKKCVVYTGTHDNDTIVGWFNSLSAETKKYALEYMNKDVSKLSVDSAGASDGFFEIFKKDRVKNVNWDFINLAMSSVADTCIIPLQDYLGTGSDTRINIPSTLGTNWLWKLDYDYMSEKTLVKITNITKRYYRFNKTFLGERNMLNKLLKEKYNTSLKDADNELIFKALLEIVKDKISDAGTVDKKKKVYYISAEFLIGKLLSNNLINLGIYEEIEKELADAGKTLSEIEELENEPSLGNGGLGRLASCFLDSIATLGLCGDGIGLNYHLGLFKQKFSDNKQCEEINPWIDDNSWLEDTGKSYKVSFKDFTLKSKMYDITVTGYGGKCNKLHLFDIENVNENMVHDGISFNKNDIEHNLTLFLYPDDSDEYGKLLRIYQQYFMVSNGAQYIIDDVKSRGGNLYELDKYAVIQINDTHPTLIIPELIYRLTHEGIDIDTAIDITSKVCAYTNHTILAEALEKWPMSYLEKVVPHLVSIIKTLDKKVREKYDDKAVYIIDDKNTVHMAHIDIHYGFSVNGVAKLHTDILMENELNHFYKIYPDKFNNKTNGITFRRWLIECNRPLEKYITSLVGDAYKKEAGKLTELTKHIDDKEVLNKILDIKSDNKKALSDYLLKTQNITINPDSIFDIQTKRLHEYKRQQLNALYIINKYFEIKNGIIPEKPITFIFGAKAASAYVIAKDIIHLILCLSELIENDKEVSKHLKVVMVENYNVTLAEKIIPACDISEQISLASKEASGTGNMKFMLNGAVTLGTMDGANVEIANLVGDDNIYIFGASSDEVIEHYKKADYVSKKIYESDLDIKKAVDFIAGEEMLKLGDKKCLERLRDELINKDWFMTLLDFEDYKKVKDKAIKDYADREKWAKKMLVNIAKAGYSSSDRTIMQYNSDIWHLDI